MKPLVYKKSRRDRTQVVIRHKSSITKGDTVQVIRGDDKGKRGKVLQVFPKKGMIKVEGLNIVTRHLRHRRGVERKGAGTLLALLAALRRGLLLRRGRHQRLLGMA